MRIGSGRIHPPLRNVSMGGSERGVDRFGTWSGFVRDVARPERAIHTQPRETFWGTTPQKPPPPTTPLPPSPEGGGGGFAGRGGSCRVASPGCRSAREASLCPGLMMNCPFGAHLVHRKLTITKHSSPPHSQNAVFFLCDNPPLLDLFQPAIQERWFVPPYRQGAVHLKT